MMNFITHTIHYRTLRSLSPLCCREQENLQIAKFRLNLRMHSQYLDEFCDLTYFKSFESDIWEDSGTSYLSSLFFTFAPSKINDHDSGNTNLQHTYPKERSF